MAIKQFLNKIVPGERQDLDVLETGTKDKVLDSLRKEEIKFDESEEKELLKERLRLKKQQMVRENVFGVKDDVQDEVDINNPSVDINKSSVDINKSSVDIMKQKGLMKQSSLLNSPNKIMTKTNNPIKRNILNQPSLVSGKKNNIKRSNIKFL